MHQCKSGRHWWLNKSDADKCCNGWHRELVVAHPALGQQLPPDAQHTRIECEANIGFVWVKGPSTL